MKKLIVFTIICVLGVYGIVYFIPGKYVTPTLPFLLVFFFAVTILIHFILLKVSTKKAINFINVFMLLTLGKLMLFLSIILAYVFINREDAVNFVMSFFILYVLFTVFEVSQSLGLNKLRLKKDTKP
ncbi:MAG: hypothetical protein K9G76_11135 [Bacteroidales bacterium]|nr:hypothetical protein [Bacteroidales bacterium]MCF8404947.1 hypothetical protein [Bacteroidales bacterium]